MRNENYDRLYLIGLAMTLLVVAGLLVAWVREDTRLEHAREEFNHERVVRGRTMYVETLRLLSRHTR